MAAPSSTIDIESDVFALRLANLLRATRIEHGRSLPALAKASGGRYTREQLRRFEDGGIGLCEDLVEHLSELYGADLGTMSAGSGEGSGASYREDVRVQSFI